jgi:hypothetical protein
MNFSPRDKFGSGTSGKSRTSSCTVAMPVSSTVSTPRVRARRQSTMRIAALLFFSCVLSSTNAGGQAVGGSIYRIEGYCIVHVELNGSWAKFFDRIPENAEESPVSEKPSLKELGVYFPQTNYSLRSFGATSDGPHVLLWFPVGREDNPPFWRCTKFGPGYPI